MLEGTYNLTLVALSYVVAALASFVALDISGRINSNPGTPGRGWLWAGGAAMGLGIWSMHFIGMLAFRLPIPLGYDMAITLYSLAGRWRLRLTRCGWCRANTCPRSAWWAAH